MLRARGPVRVRGPVGLLVMVALTAASGCGGVYEEVAPAQKRRVTLILTPDFVRIGEEEKQIGAFVDIEPGDGLVTVTELDMGDDVEVVQYDSRGNKGCAGVPDPGEFEGREPVRLCLTVVLLPGAEVGERRASIEVRADGEPIIAESEFFVLRGLE